MLLTQNGMYAGVRLFFLLSSIVIGAQVADLDTVDVV